MNAAEIEAQADAAAARGAFGAARQLLSQMLTQDRGNFGGWLKLSAMARASGDDPGALTAVTEALAIDPLNFTALLIKATLLHRLGRDDDAGRAYGHALGQAPEAPPPQLAEALGTAKARYGAWQQREAAKLRAAVTAVTAMTPRLDRFVTNTVRLTAPDRAGPTHFCYPGLPETGFHPEADFAWLAQLEALTDVAQQEFEATIASQAAQLVPYIQYPAGVPVAQWAALNHNRDWTAIHLIRNGQIIAANAKTCPQVMALIAALPQPRVTGAGPNAMFSLLAPGAHIPPHTGVSNARLVCHLPLIVPPGCIFRVGAETREWERGRAFVFDDTVEHEAHNPSDRLRVVLIIDVWHPALSAEEQAAIRAVIEASGDTMAL